jgi:hypothetical protein
MSLPVAFNTQLDKFLDELIKTYPEDKDFSYYKRLIDQLKQFNIRKPIELFAGVVQKHVAEIHERNSDFFFKNFDNLVAAETNNTGSRDEAFRLFNNIKKYWVEMPAEIQKIIWDYLNVLTRLSMSFMLTSRVR